MKKNENIDWTRTHDLTVEEIKATEGLAHFTDEEAKEVIRIFKVYSGLILHLHKKDLLDQELPTTQSA